MSNTKKNKVLTAIIATLGSVALVAAGFITGTAITSKEYKHNYVSWEAYDEMRNNYKYYLDMARKERNQNDDERRFWQLAYMDTVDDNTYDKALEEAKDEFPTEHYYTYEHFKELGN